MDKSSESPNETIKTFTFINVIFPKKYCKTAGSTGTVTTGFILPAVPIPAVRTDFNDSIIQKVVCVVIHGNIETGSSLFYDNVPPE